MSSLSRGMAAAISQIGLLSLVATTAIAQPVLPDFASAAFDNSLQIDNPYFPLVPGTKLTYDVVSTDPDSGEVETELILVEVLNQTRTVAGVETRVVRDRVWLEGLLIEDTFDWYAQDNAGNVWYMGEEVTDFEYDDEGNLIGTSHPGAWEAGVAGDLPGYLMKANPMVGDQYYQEFSPGNAEDEAEVIALGESHTIPLGTFNNVLRTLETSALDPTALENKLYAPGIGKILEFSFDIDTGAVVGVGTLRSVSLVPEPGSATLLLSAAAALFAGFRRRFASFR